MSPEKLIAIPGRLTKVDRGRAALDRVTDPRHHQVGRVLTA